MIRERSVFVSDSLGTIAHRGTEQAIELTRIGHVQRLQLKPQGVGGGGRLGPEGLAVRAGGIS
jgi:hypothetical protein